MRTRFNHAGVSALEILTALAIGYWLGARPHQWLPGLPDIVQSLLGS